MSVSCLFVFAVSVGIYRVRRYMCLVVLTFLSSPECSPFFLPPSAALMSWLHSPYPLHVEDRPMQVSMGSARACVASGALPLPDPHPTSPPFFFFFSLFSPSCFSGRIGLFQYVLIRLASTGVALVLQLGHLYTEGDFDPKRGYLWITVVTCVSQSWALYVLVLFYRCGLSKRRGGRRGGGVVCAGIRRGIQ